MDDLLDKRLARLAQGIARLERKTDFILKELKLQYTDDPEASVTEEFKEVYALLKQGKKLQAIQAYRKITGAGLAQASVDVDGMEQGRHD